MTGSKIEFRPPEICLVRFPFSSLENSKKRPALVLNSLKISPRNGLVTVAMITSQVEGMRLAGDVLLQEWKEEGLLHPSLVRLSKIATLDSDLIEKRLGKLSMPDERQVKLSFTRLYRFWHSPSK